MTKRLDILKASLEKKEAAMDAKISEHFATVKEANGQPLNDKRNGAATSSPPHRRLRNLWLLVTTYTSRSPPHRRLRNL